MTPARDPRTALSFAAAFLLLLGVEARAQDAVVVAANVDRVADGSGGGATVLWIHPRGTDDTVVAGATFMSLVGTRWFYGTVGATRRISERMLANGEANLGRGEGDAGGFRYLLLRGGVTHEAIAKQLYVEAEWLQSDVARQQDGIARIGATFMADARLTLRGSVYQSLFGDNDVTLATLRADYDLGRFSAIVGLSGGTAAPFLLQQPGSDETRVREAFGGVVVDRWTVVLSTLSSGGEGRRRLSVSWRLPLLVGSPAR